MPQLRQDHVPPAGRAVYPHDMLRLRRAAGAPGLIGSPTRAGPVSKEKGTARGSGVSEYERRFE